MRLKTWICTALLTMLFCTSVFAAGSPVPVMHFAPDTSDEQIIELTGTKVITEDFSFKLPDHWDTACILVPNENSYEIYEKSNYEEDDSGLLFSIDCYEDAELEDLTGCSILGFCGNRTYILVPYYEEFIEDSSESLYLSCEKAAKQMKKSFVAYVRE